MAAATYPAVRIITFPAARRLPRRVSILAGLVVIYLVAVVAAAFLAPTLLRVGAVTIGLGLLLALWRGRESYGRGRKRPPGRIDIVPIRPAADADFYLDKAEKYGPVFKIGAPYPSFRLIPTVCIVGHDKARDVLRANAASLELAYAGRMSKWIPKGFLRYMSPDDHKVYRDVFRAALAPSVSDEFEPHIEGSIDRVLERMAEHPDAFEVKPHLETLILDIMCQVLFGFEPGSEESAEFGELLSRVKPGRLSRFLDPRQEDALEQLVAMVLAQAQAPTTATPSRPRSSLHLIGEFDAKYLQDRTVAGNLIYMVPVAIADLVGLAQWLMKMLSENPEWVAKLRRNGLNAGAGAHPLDERIVMETLRLEQSEYLRRRVLEDIEIDDFVVPKGWVVRACIREGHRDEGVFEDATSFNPDRFLGRTYLRSEYAPFGMDQHHCLGDKLTMTFARAFVRELSAGYDWSLVNGGGRQWEQWHWTPHARLEMRMNPRHDRQVAGGVGLE